MGQFVDHDIVKVWKSADGGRGTADLLVALYRGDEVAVVERTESAAKVRLGEGREGWVRGPLRVTDKAPLAFAFVDVGQGDACLLTTPGGYKILVDGGENQLAARYLASRYWSETSVGKDVVFDAIVATHGDADHFDGLSKLILDAAVETRERKRIRVAARRVYHNGLVKRGAAVPERERLGTPIALAGGLGVRVVDDPRSVADANQPFRRWNHALDELAKRAPFEIRRLEFGDKDAFAFLDDGVRIDVLGPRAHRLPDGGSALALLSGEQGGLSASHTINGHSVVLRVSIGNVGVLLTGDIHARAEEEMVRAHQAGELPLRAEVLKVPHHGSSDVAPSFLEAVGPLISVVSAGDEDARRDHLHPRADLLAMLGGCKRGAPSVVFVTNLAAFDAWAGRAFRAVERQPGVWEPDLAAGTFYARERTAYGIIHARTDGQHLLVVRRGASPLRYEAYAYSISADGSAAKLAVDTI
jgi:beta-lactamase superfamily II metal-dependent hydrolase